MAVIETALTRLLDIEHPILLAPMGSAAGGKLAAAVTNAGGLGMVGSGYANVEAIRKELGEAGNTRVGIGFILWALEKNSAALDVALDARPAAVMLSFGDPTPFTGRIKAAGSKIICQIQTLAQAKQAAQAGADVIIAQGRDAGGHSGTTRGTIGLVPAVVDAVAPIPVVAAGGIADGRGLAAALTLGAAGISMGLYPGLTIAGVVGNTYGIQYTINLTDASSWTTLTNLTLTDPVQLWLDTSSDATDGTIPHRTYRVVAVP